MQMFQKEITVIGIEIGTSIRNKSAAYDPILYEIRNLSPEKAREIIIRAINGTSP